MLVVWQVSTGASWKNSGMKWTDYNAEYTEILERLYQDRSMDVLTYKPGNTPTFETDVASMQQRNLTSGKFRAVRRLLMERTDF